MFDFIIGFWLFLTFGFAYMIEIDVGLLVAYPILIGYGL